MRGDLESAPTPIPRPDLRTPVSSQEYQKISSTKTGFRILPPFMDKGPTFKFDPISTLEAQQYDAAVRKVFQREGIKIFKEKRYNPNEDEDFRFQSWEVLYSKPDVNDKLYGLRDEIEKEVKRLKENR